MNDKETQQGSYNGVNKQIIMYIQLFIQKRQRKRRSCLTEHSKNCLFFLNFVDYEIIWPFLGLELLSLQKTMVGEAGSNLPLTVHPKSSVPCYC